MIVPVFFFLLQVSLARRVYCTKYDASGSVYKPFTDNCDHQCCLAQNEGVLGSSDHVYLNVKCESTLHKGLFREDHCKIHFSDAPYCVGQAMDSTGQGIGVALEDKLNIKCEVEANPPPTNFVWKFNTSKDIWSVPDSDIIMEGFNSIASVSVRNEDAFQNLLCWGENDIGTQQIPCLYYLLPPSNRQYSNS